MAPRRLKPGWKILGGLALAAALWFGVPPVARRMGFFRLRHIEFSGLTNLTAKRLMPAIALSPTASLFDPMDQVTRRLAAVPGVVSVSVHRRIPGTLRVNIEEAVPVALASNGSGMTLVDEHGRTLPFDPAASAPDLPIMARPDSAVAGLLARVREVDPTLFANISDAWRSGRDVILQVDSRRYWFRPNASAEAILAVMAVAEDLARAGKDYMELDGRFAGQVVVRWRGA
jgi:cell division septal protein FtsQ